MSDLIEEIRVGAPYVLVPEEDEPLPASRGAHFARGAPAFAEAMRVMNLPWQTTLDGDIVSGAAPRPAVAPDDGDDSRDFGDIDSEAPDPSEMLEPRILVAADPPSDREDAAWARAAAEATAAAATRLLREGVASLIETPGNTDVPTTGGGSPARVSAPPPPPDEEMTAEELRELGDVLGDESPRTPRP
jgi:hypothetical protein